MQGVRRSVVVAIFVAATVFACVPLNTPGDTASYPVPSADHKVAEDATPLINELNDGPVQFWVRDHVLPSFRRLAVSYCSHDIYSGANTADPHNANVTLDGKARTTNGLLATKAAIQFTQSLYPTTKTFLLGTSAGSVGSFGVAWSMQQQGIPLSGIIADASIVNLEARDAKFAQGSAPGSRTRVAARRSRPECIRSSPSSPTSPTSSFRPAG